MRYAIRLLALLFSVVIAPVAAQNPRQFETVLVTLPQASGSAGTFMSLWERAQPATRALGLADPSQFAVNPVAD